jgi:hypothetical protein
MTIHIKLITFLLLIFSFYGCKKEVVLIPTTDVLANLGNNIVLPAYKNILDQSLLMNSAASIFKIKMERF